MRAHGTGGKAYDPNSRMTRRRRAERVGRFERRRANQLAGSRLNTSDASSRVADPGRHIPGLAPEKQNTANPRFKAEIERRRAENQKQQEENEKKWQKRREAKARKKAQAHAKRLERRRQRKQDEGVKGAAATDGPRMAWDRGGASTHKTQPRDTNNSDDGWTTVKRGKASVRKEVRHYHQQFR